MRTIVVLSLLVLLCPLAVAKEDPAAAPLPGTPDETALRLIQAVAAGDEATIKTLAERNSPDPWLVADQLCRRGAHDTAIVFAKAGVRPATEKLAAYVNSRRGKQESAEGYGALRAAMLAVRARKPEVGLAALPLKRPPADTVLGALLHMNEAKLLKLAGRPADALSSFVLASEGAARIGWRHWAGLGFTYAGRVQSDLGDRERAFVYFERGLKLWQEIGFALGTAAALAEMAAVANTSGDKLAAIGYYERALRKFPELGDRAWEAGILHTLGIVCADVGNYRKALTYYNRVLPMWEALGDRGQWAGTQINIGSVESALGNYPKAIAYFERGISEARAVDRGDYEAYGTLNLAGVYWRIGNHARALVYTESAVAMLKTTGGAGAMTNALTALGLLRIEFGDLKGAIKLFSVVLAQAALLGPKEAEAGALSGLGRAYSAGGEYEKAIEHYERGKAIAEEIGDRVVHADCVGAIGSVLIKQGKRQEGIELLKRCEREARRLRARSLIVWSLTELVRAHLEAGRPERAMFLAREARTEVEYLLGGLGADEAATARGKYADLFGNGALAAARVGDTAEALAFLESGRAGALLELLGGRHALRWSDIPVELRRAEADAKMRETQARAAYRRAIAGSAGGDLEVRRSAARALDRAQNQLRKVTDRILREADSNTTTLFYPRAAPLEELQALLDEHDALVIYGMSRTQALGFLITSKAARVVELGDSADLSKLGAATVASDPSVDLTKAVAMARKAFVEPLALPKGVKRVLVSPEAVLCYVPFGLLFDRPVALTASGTTYAFLRREQRSRGTGVLALGNPEYAATRARASEVYVRGGALTPLPSTGPEAKAVGDTVLLGKDASEAGLRKALAERERWRAVHFACHGLVDRERPLLSALALSGSEGDDGFLTALEVLRMEIPADLAVLSACDTGGGKVIGGEGIVGLTRAFMYAGAPRVLCSLWKVDDKATQALMIKFYELWKGKAGASERSGSNGRGLGAAAALEQAQAYVRSHEKWKHPYYWAAWVLWGLPD